MLKIFLRLWQVNWAEQWQYRANLIMYLLYDLTSPVVYLAVWRAIASAQGEIKGLNANDFTIYYLTMLLVGKLTGDITIHILAYKIQDGTLSGELLRPIHPVLTNTLVNNIAYKFLSLIVMIPVWIVLFLLFRPDFSTVAFPNLFLAAPALVMGFLINFLSGAFFTSIAFWTTRTFSLMEFIWGISLILGGVFVPLDLLPEFAQKVALLLPFQLYNYFPIQLILGKLTPEQVLLDFVLQLAWLAILAWGFRTIWRAGLKRFSAVGA